MDAEELARLADEFEAQEQQLDTGADDDAVVDDVDETDGEDAPDEDVPDADAVEPDTIVTDRQDRAEETPASPIVRSTMTGVTAATPATLVPSNGDFTDVVSSVQHDILTRAQEKFSDEKIVDKHAEALKRVADRALEVDAERASLTVQAQDADNRVRRQEIRNSLIKLKAEAKRLAREQKQLNREQKADHKARNKAAKWELYKDKLERMHYTYVPCAFVLGMLLLFDGIRSFFDGLGTVSTAIVKALKWVLLIGAILIVLFSIPVTRDWLTNLLSGGH